MNQISNSQRKNTKDNVPVGKVSENSFTSLTPPQISET